VNTTSTWFFVLKPCFILLYIGFGGFCFLVASRYYRVDSAWAVDKRGSPALSVLLPAVAASLLIAIFAITGSHLLLAAAAIGVVIFAVRHSAWRAPLSLLAAAAAIILVLSLAWWRIAPSAVAPLPLAAFAVILGGLMVGFSDSWHRRPDTLAIPLAMCLVAGFLLLIDLGGYRPGEPILEALAHHWGAFIGPVLQIQAGLVPFYDIPLQYGLGPTLMIATACRDTGCWTSTEIIVVIMDLANALLILRMALATAVPRGWLWHCTAMIAVFAALFLWTGFPADGSSLLAVPSVGGIRFLPTTLVACLLFFGFPTGATAALVPAVLWSPESAAMSVAVFGLSETARIGPLKAALRSAGLLACSYAGLVLLHHAIFGVWMDPAAFAEYVLHVPGALPIDPFSDALLLAAVLGLGGWLMVRVSPDPVTAHRDRTSTFLLFAAATYWLGRSHPNNICNLAPFLVLVALRVLDRPTGHSSLLADVTGFGLATSVAALAMSPWYSVPYDAHATVDIHAVVAEFPSFERDIEQIREQIANSGGLGIADFGPSYTRHPSETLVWTPMDPSSLWSYVPSQRRQIYIRRSGTRLRRSGWAISNDDQGVLLDDLRAGYSMSEQRSFNGAPSTPGGPPTHYVAVCFNPRPDIAASIVGSACPFTMP
jgi:hypothetical protein